VPAEVASSKDQVVDLEFAVSATGGLIVSFFARGSDKAAARTIIDKKAGGGLSAEAIEKIVGDAKEARLATLGGEDDEE